MASASALTAGPAFDPPRKNGAPASSIPGEILAEWLDHATVIHEYQEYQGQNELLKALAEKALPLQVAAGIPTELGGGALFPAAPFPSGDKTAVACGVASADATALRLCVGLDRLEAGEELWMVDPTGPRAFGPYSRGDAQPGGRWLPTVGADTAVLVARGAADVAERVNLTGVAHFFQGIPDLKVLPCNINIACATEPEVQARQSGVGMAVVPTGYGDMILCSGTLINNDDTPQNEPYFITAWHCGIGRDFTAAQIDVVWDYQATECGGAAAPNLATLPRSTGTRVLVNSGTLDVTLLELDEVPDGVYGRAYLGWTTAVPQPGNGVVGIHHPDGSHKRISYGTVTDVDVPALGFSNETEVHWDSGVTEGGSSGSCLLLQTEGYAITGMLSGGPFHSCATNVNNYDYYSSFRDFYPLAENYLGSGDGGGGDETFTVAMQEVTGDAGSRVDVPLYLTRAAKVASDGAPSSISVNLAFDPEVLAPIYSEGVTLVEITGSERLGLWYGKSMQAIVHGPGQLGAMVFGGVVSIGGSYTTTEITTYDDQRVGGVATDQENPFLIGTVAFNVIGNEGDQTALTLSGPTAFDRNGVALPLAASSGSLAVVDTAVFGDVDGNGAVDAVDVQNVINAALGLGDMPCDLDCDGAINAMDVQLVINAALGL